MKTETSSAPLWKVLSNLLIMGDGTRKEVEAKFPRFHAEDHQAAREHVRKNYPGAVAAIVQVS